jgi:hypothetical protein
VKPFRSWAGIVLLAIAVMLLALVAMDILGVRQVLPLTIHYDWLAFLGALVGGIVGGLFTFGGVYFTLRHQRETDQERRESERLQREADERRTRLSIMPLFEYAVSYDKADFDNSAGQLADEPGMPVYTLDGGVPGDPGSFEFLYDIVVRNVGLGHGLLTNVTLNFLDNHHEFIQSENYGFVNYLVKKDSRRDLRHFIHTPRNSPRFSDPRQQVYAIEVVLQFEDLLGNRYEQRLMTSISKALYASEDPSTGGKPVAHFSHADPPIYLAR